MRLLWVPRASAPELGTPRELLRRGHSVRILDRKRLAGLPLAVKEALFFRPQLAWIELGPENVSIAAALAGARVPLVLAFDDSIRSVSEAGIGLVAALLSARRVVAENDAIASHLAERLGARQVHVLPQPFDPAPFEPGERRKSREAVGLPLDQKIIALVAPLDGAQRLELLAEAHRKLTGVALLVCGEGPGAAFVRAMGLAARPSSPVIDLGSGALAAQVVSIRVADAGVSVRASGAGPESAAYAAMGRRQAVLDATAPPPELYPGLESVHVAEQPTAEALAGALRRALDAEARLGPLDAAAISGARSRLGDRVQEVLSIAGSVASER